MPTLSTIIHTVVWFSLGVIVALGARHVLIGFYNQ